MKAVRKKTLPDYLMYPLRIIAILSAAGLFLPAINPARTSELISSKISLFTSGTAYTRLTEGFTRAVNKGWVQTSTLKLIFIASIIAIIGIIIAGIGVCLSLGSLKLKRLGLIFSACGSVLTIVSMAAYFTAYHEFSNSSNIDKVKPVFAYGVYFFLILAVLQLILSAIIFITLPKTVKEDRYEMESKYKLFLMMMPFLALAFVFSYLPLWGWRVVFFDYQAGTPLSADNFVGFHKFTILFKNAATRNDILRVMKNTLIMSGLGIATSWCAMAFAIFMTEIKKMRYRNILQTLTTIPNFLSWVLVYAIALAIFSSDGFVNSVLVDLGVFSTPRLFLQEAQGTHLKMLAWGMWKGLGWSAIIYIAAITGVDQELYEAATVDGAGRFRRMWHITVPSILPTYFVLLLLSIAGILSNGMDQYLVFENAMNASKIEVLDLYVYNLGIRESSDISLATVVGMCKSIISIMLLFIANQSSKLLRGESIV